MDSEDDPLVAAIRSMTLAAETQRAGREAVNSRIAELEARIVSLEEERQALVDDNASMADQIAEYEAQEKRRRESGNGADPGDDPFDTGAGTNIPLLPIPEWRVRHITCRISTGERLTIYNCMYINMYSMDNRFLHADKFRDRIVRAFKQMCLRFAAENDIPSDINDIPTDFEIIKVRLHDLATVNERSFIRDMFQRSV